MFPAQLERNAFRADNGEFGWTRAQIPRVIEILCSHAMGILGGELWRISDGVPGWRGAIPQREGPPGVYVWNTERRSGEDWQNFVKGGASDALAAVERWPEPGDLRFTFWKSKALVPIEKPTGEECPNVLFSGQRCVCAIANRTGGARDSRAESVNARVAGKQAWGSRRVLMLLF